MKSVSIPNSVTTIYTATATLNGTAYTDTRTEVLPAAVPTVVASGSCGDSLTWTLDEAGVLTVSGTGDMWDWGYGGSGNETPWAEYARSITSAVLEEGVSSVGECAFLVCGITELSLPDTLLEIHRAAFQSCHALKTVEIPDSVSSIGACAFEGTGLSSVTIPSGVTELDPAAFFHCHSLERFTVSEDNPAYCAVDGVLFSKDGACLIAYPAGNPAASYTVPAKVTQVTEGAFHLCMKLSALAVEEGNAAYTAVDGVLFTGDMRTLAAYPYGKEATDYAVPEGVQRLADYAFWCCSLETVTLPESVTDISWAFDRCRNLTEILYGGSPAQWERVLGSDSYALENVTVRYGKTDGPTVDIQPTDVMVITGETATFTVTASGEDLTYQWYVQKTEGGAWTAVKAASGKTAEYRLTAEKKHNGYRYYCKVSDGANTVDSDTVTLTVCSRTLAIEAQPTDVTVRSGETATFAVTATGENLTYQWYVQKMEGGAWTAVKAAAGKTAAYSLTAEKKHSGYRYFCRVSDGKAVHTSTIVTLTVSDYVPIRIEALPELVAVFSGETATFTVNATGEGLTYRWYYAKPDSEEWTAVSKNGKAATYTLTAQARHDGYRYRCVVTDGFRTVCSATVNLIVMER